MPILVGGIAQGGIEWQQMVMSVVVGGGNQKPGRTGCGRGAQPGKASRVRVRVGFKLGGGGDVREMRVRWLERGYSLLLIGENSQHASCTAAAAAIISSSNSQSSYSIQSNIVDSSSKPPRQQPSTHVMRDP